MPEVARGVRVYPSLRLLLSLLLSLALALAPARLTRWRVGSSH